MIGSSGTGRRRLGAGLGALAVGTLWMLATAGCASHHRQQALERRVSELEAQLYELRSSVSATPAGAPVPGRATGPGAGEPGGSGGPGVARAPTRRLSLGEAWREVCEGRSSVPIELSGSRHFVDVMLRGPKGSGRFRFQIDTGGSTPGLTLARSAADALGFDRAKGADALPRTITLGGREIALPEGVHWAVVDEDAAAGKGRPTRAPSARRGYSLGQIGAGFLSRFLVCIDPAAGRLGLADPTETEIDPDDRSAIPILLQPGGPNHALYPFVHVLLEARGAYSGSYGMLLDTGATTSMLEGRELDRQAKSNPEWPRAKGTAGDADMIAGQFAETMLLAGALYVTSPGLERWRDNPPSAAEWEQFPKLHPPVDAGPALLVERPQGTFRQMFGEVGYAGGPHGALGNDVLGRFRLMLDYRGARLWLEPEATAAPASASLQRVGVALGFGADGCPVVRQITDSNADETRSKLRVGDALTAIDGEPACQLWHHQLAAKLAGRAGERRSLELRRAGKKLVVDVPIADLFAPRGPKRAGDKLFTGERPAPPPSPARPADKLFTGDRPAASPAPTRPADKLFR